MRINKFLKKASPEGTKLYHDLLDVLSNSDAQTPEIFIVVRSVWIQLMGAYIRPRELLAEQIEVLQELEESEFFDQYMQEIKNA